MALEGLRVEARNLLRRVLEVAVGHHHPAPLGLGEPGRDRPVLTEVPAQPDQPDVFVPLSQLLEYLPGAVIAAIVDEDELKAVDEGPKDRCQALMQRVKTIPAPIDWDDHAQLDHASG